ncbi:MAG: class I SAM-dependent methyltransferase [Promethearchaeota archaeon]
MSSFDWDEYWRIREEPEDAREFAVKMADRVATFTSNKRIESVADFGCGPASMLFELAERFPHVTFHGFDTALSVVEMNRAKVAQNRFSNLHFIQDQLPRPQTGKIFDLVICLSTLHYIRDIGIAVQNLFSRVCSGGYLLFNYPNIFSRAMYRRDIQSEDECMKSRFALVLLGANLLSFRRIAYLLGVWPRKFYASIRGNIYVIVRKPS